MRRAGLLLGLGLLLARPAGAQPLDMAHGGPIAVTAQDGLEWRQSEQVVIARGDARATRGNVTVVADRLIAHYRKKPGAGPAPSPKPDGEGGATIGEGDTSGNEIFRVEAEGHVHIFTPTDHAEADRAVYDLDQAVLVMTGRNLRLTTPSDVLTARDDMEYWAQKHMAVARGEAVVVTNDGRRLAADTLVAYTAEGQSVPAAAGKTASPPAATKAAAVAPSGEPKTTPPGAAKPPDDPLAASGKLQRVEGFGHVSVRTATETVTGDRAVYTPDSGIARLVGNVRITRGQNQLNGAEADVNLRTGISRLISGSAGRVQGLVVPNDAQAATGGGAPAPAKAKQPKAGR